LSLRSASLRAGVAAGAVLLVAAPAALGAPARVAGGDTTLRLDRGTVRALTGAGVAVAPVRPARARGVRVAFPISRGRIDAAGGTGRLDHRGGLRISAGHRAVRLTAFRIRGLNLSARAGGQRIHILKLRAGNARVRRSATTTRLSGVRAELTGKAARALNAALHTTLFRKGIRLGTATIDADLAQLAITGGATSLAVDAGALAALTSLAITPGLVAPASVGSDGSFAFPITRGTVDAATLAGRVRHSGGISLTRGATRVELTSFTIVVDDSPQLTARVGGARVPILDLDVSGLTQDVDGLDVTLGNVRGTLTAEAAGALNQAFATTAFTEGLLLGVATVRAEL
jgi:hypothetical protein